MLLAVKKAVSILAAAAAIALLVLATTSSEVQASSFSCQQTGSCPNQATCEGSNFVRDGCTIQCLVPLEGSASGELVNAGSATCGSGGGGGDDGGGDWWCGTYCW
jgi:hypothetical protein